jgi:prepilin-type N-terminal cleavage/methylation domain-containing protein
MKKTYKINTQNGFTLIETLMAMAIFTIGILGLFGMQTAAIKENLTANAITTGSTWATDRVERLLAMDYADPGLAETVATCSALPTSFTDPGWSVDPKEPGSTGGPRYSVYWAVATDCFLTNIPDNSDPDQEQKPKYLRIIVTRDAGTGEQEISILNYIVQNIKG